MHSGPNLVAENFVSGREQRVCRDQKRIAFETASEEANRLVRELANCIRRGGSFRLLFYAAIHSQPSEVVERKGVFREDFVGPGKRGSRFVGLTGCHVLDAKVIPNHRVARAELSPFNEDLRSFSMHPHFCKDSC
jgi:hypothetical protein